MKKYGLSGRLPNSDKNTLKEVTDMLTLDLLIVIIPVLVGICTIATFFFTRSKEKSDVSAKWAKLETKLDTNLEHIREGQKETDKKFDKIEERLLDIKQLTERVIKVEGKADAALRNIDELKGRKAKGE